MDDDILIRIIACIMGFVVGFFMAGLFLQEPEVKTTELQQKYEEYVKQNEWKNEYIEWLQDQLYKKYEGVE